MTITAELKCSHCKHKDKYSSADIIYDHLICKKCGKQIKVNKWINAVDPDYISIKGTVMRRDPKVHMSKKERRRMRDEEER